MKKAEPDDSRELPAARPAIPKASEMELRPGVRKAPEASLRPSRGVLS
ncbi:hypothetical protein [Amycolatopsis sp. NPDC004625]